MQYSVDCDHFCRVEIQDSLDIILIRQQAIPD